MSAAMPVVPIDGSTSARKRRAHKACKEENGKETSVRQMIHSASQALAICFASQALGVEKKDKNEKKDKKEKQDKKSKK